MTILRRAKLICIGAICTFLAGGGLYFGFSPEIYQNILFGRCNDELKEGLSKLEYNTDEPDPRFVRTRFSSNVFPVDLVTGNQLISVLKNAGVIIRETDYFQLYKIRNKESFQVNIFHRNERTSESVTIDYCGRVI